MLHNINMEKDSDITQEIDLSKNILEPSELTRKEILGYIEEITVDLRKAKDTKHSIYEKRLALAELLDTLGLDYTTPAYYPKLRQLMSEQTKVDKLADIVADRIGDNADTVDLQTITDIRNMDLEHALFAATVTLVRNGKSAEDLNKLIRNT